MIGHKKLGVSHMIGQKKRAPSMVIGVKKRIGESLAPLYQSGMPDVVKSPLEKK